MRYWFSIAATAAILAASAACGGSSSPKSTPVPTTAAVSTPVAAPSPAASGAQPDVPPADASTPASGTIQSVAADKVTLTDGSTIGLAATTRLVSRSTIPASDLKKGDFVAITAKRQTDNTLLASIVSIFPASFSSVRSGQSPMPEGNLMTNATIDSISGDMFTVTFTGGGAKVQIAPGAQIIKQTDATNADLKPGLKITASVTAGVARSLTILQG